MIMGLQLFWAQLGCICIMAYIVKWLALLGEGFLRTGRVSSYYIIVF